MEDFIKQNYSLLTRIIEVIPALVGVVLFKYYKNTSVKYFIYFLIYVFASEITGSYPRYFANYEFLKPFKDYVKGTVFQRNYWWFTVFWYITSAMFFSFYFRKVLINRRFKKALKYISLVFLISSAAYVIIYWSNFYSADSYYINFFSTGIILLCVIFYFIELLQDETIIGFNKSINFYISIILFIWLLITTPLIFYNIYFRAEDWNFVFLQREIYLFSNAFMYIGFALALILCKPKIDNI